MADGKRPTATLEPDAIRGNPLPANWRHAAPLMRGGIIRPDALRRITLGTSEELIVCALLLLEFFPMHSGSQQCVNVAI